MIAGLTLLLLLGGGQGVPQSLPPRVGEVPRSGDGGAYHLAIYKEAALEAGKTYLSPEPQAKEFVAAKGEWIQKPTTLKSLKGKVVLVDFWAYTCVNCIRTFPYMNEWYRRYHDKGLEIVAIHRPEFEFEGEPKNVAAAVKRFGFQFPVLNDRESVNWANYNVSAWPSKFLIDGKGNFVHAKVGEGRYDEFERQIQKQLALINPKVKMPSIMPPVRETDAPGAVCYPATLEVFFARKQTSHFGEEHRNKRSLFNYPDKMQNGVYFSGYWKPTRQYVEAEKGSAFKFKYTAKDVNSVIRTTGGPAIAEIYQNGKPLAADSLGSDVKMVNGVPTLQMVEPRMYNIISNPEWGRHDFEVRFKSGTARLYTLSFGTGCREVKGKRR